MKKLLCALLALGMTFAMAFSAVACGGDGKKPGESSQENSSEQGNSTDGSSTDGEEGEEEIFKPDYTSASELTEYFSGKTGAVTYNTGKDLVIESLTTDAPIYLGAASTGNILTVDGGPYSERLLTIQGAGGGVVQANGGILVLKNLTIRNDTHAFNSNGYRDYYAEFGGKVRFENCKIECSMQLRNDADAEFINCEIKSPGTQMYGIWVADGSAKFDGCAFTGHRALKVHEYLEMDVVNVTVENCTFTGISEKPAIAIDIDDEMSTTTITFANCEIDYCANYKREDGVVGEDGFYERVTYADEIPGTFTFTATDCLLDGEKFNFVDGTMSFPDWEE